MAINYAEANLAWDAMCDSRECWLKKHADRTCGECATCEPCPCGCEYGLCHKDGEFVGLNDKVGDYELFCWNERRGHGKATA